MKAVNTLSQALAQREIHRLHFYIILFKSFNHLSHYDEKMDFHFQG